MRKRVMALLLSMGLATSVLPGGVLAADFTDVDAGHWAKAAIDRWSDYGIVSGDPDGGFRPGDSIKTSEAAKIFAELLKLTSTEGAIKFADVADDAWYADYFAKCSAAGVIRGVGSNDAGEAMADPDSQISRERFFVMFARLLDIAEEDSSDNPLTQDANIDAWAQKYINALVNHGYVKGSADPATGEASLLPDENINRASVMSLLNQTIGAYANEQGKEFTAGEGMNLVVAPGATLTGNGGTVLMADSASNGTLTLKNGTVDTVDVHAKNAKVSLDGSATVKNGVIHASDVTFDGSGKLQEVFVAGNNAKINTNGTQMIVANDATGATENGRSVNPGETVITNSWSIPTTTQGSWYSSGGNGGTPQVRPTPPPESATQHDVVVWTGDYTVDKITPYEGMLEPRLFVDYGTGNRAVATDIFAVLDFKDTSDAEKQEIERRLADGSIVVTVRRTNELYPLMHQIDLDAELDEPGLLSGLYKSYTSYTQWQPAGEETVSYTITVKDSHTTGNVYNTATDQIITVKFGEITDPNAVAISPANEEAVAAELENLERVDMLSPTQKQNFAKEVAETGEATDKASEDLTAATNEKLESMNTEEVSTKYAANVGVMTAEEKVTVAEVVQEIKVAPSDAGTSAVYAISANGLPEIRAIQTSITVEMPSESTPGTEVNGSARVLANALADNVAEQLNGGTADNSQMDSLKTAIQATKGSSSDITPGDVLNFLNSSSVQRSAADETGSLIMNDRETLRTISLNDLRDMGAVSFSFVDQNGISQMLNFDFTTIG